jgi:hypothetical protein
MFNYVSIKCKQIVIRLKRREIQTLHRSKWFAFFSYINIIAYFQSHLRMISFEEN